MVLETGNCRIMLKLYLYIKSFLGLSDEDNVPAKKKSKPEHGNTRVSDWSHTIKYVM